MPTSTLTPCSYPGCTILVRRGRCDVHRGTVIDRHNQDGQRLYNTVRWHQLRHAQLARQPWCEECLKQGIYTPATDVDHKERHEGDPVRFFGGPLQSLCHNCHSRKTASEVFGYAGG